MKNVIQQMIARYDCKNNLERKNALKEIIQEIALLGLFRSGFFNYAGFYEGTALRIFYNLPRFSEDLDFSLIKADNDFLLAKHLKSVQNELNFYGFEMDIEEKIKNHDSNIKSAFIKGNTIIHLIKIVESKNKVRGINRNEKIQIKLEIDINPPLYADYDVKYLLNPIPFSVRLFDLPSLFAGKIHALLFRSWGNRVKGRDFYDYVWYLSNYPKINLVHLTERMRQTGDWNIESNIQLSELKEMLHKRFKEVDFEQAKLDIEPFILNRNDLALWNKEFFDSITKSYLV